MAGEVSADAYAAIARWYDVEHESVIEDIECFQELIANADLRNPAILEIGSGTGRVLTRLAAAGYMVTGVEPSEAMRERCAHRLASLPERVSRRVRSLTGDAERLPLPDNEQFDVALFSLNTFAHLTTLAARQKALKELSSHLRPDALILLDLDLAGPQRLAATAGQLWWQGTWPIPENNAVLLTHLVTATHSATAGVLQVTHLYDTHEQGGAMSRTISTMGLALLSKGEIEVTLHATGYGVDEIYGGYDLSLWSDDAPHAIFAAHWPGRTQRPSLTPRQ